MIEPRLIRTLRAPPWAAASPSKAPMPASVTACGLPISRRDLCQSTDFDRDAADLERHVGGDDEAGLDGGLCRAAFSASVSLGRR